VPLVEVDGLHLVQSHAILRHLTRRFGWDDAFTGAQKAAVDMLADGTGGWWANGSRSKRALQVALALTLTKYITDHALPSPDLPSFFCISICRWRGAEDVRKQLMTIKYDEALSAETKLARFDAW